jgi:hypothetical protein
MTRSLFLVLLLFLPYAGQQSQPKCNDIVGSWKWFVGPQLEIKADHTFSNGENYGTWEVTNAKEKKYRLRWELGAFIDEVILSADGKKLTGTNNQKNNVSGERVGDCAVN